MSDKVSSPVGRKNDAGKLDWSILQLDLLEDVIRVLMYGETKYDRENYQHVTPARRYWSAALRHMSLYRSGQRNDEETGISHLAHAIASLLFLTWFEKYKSFGPKNLSEALPKQPQSKAQAQKQSEPQSSAITQGAATKEADPKFLAETERLVAELKEQNRLLQAQVKALQNLSW